MELLLSAAGDPYREDALCGGVACQQEDRQPRGADLDALVDECVSRSRGATCMHASLSGSNGADPRLVAGRNSAYARFLRRGEETEGSGAAEPSRRSKAGPRAACSGFGGSGVARTAARSGSYAEAYSTSYAAARGASQVSGGASAYGRVRHSAAPGSPGPWASPRAGVTIGPRASQGGLRQSDLESPSPARRLRGSLPPGGLEQSLAYREELDRALGVHRPVDNLQALLHVARALMCCNCHARLVEERLVPGETHYLVLTEDLEYRGLARLGADGNLHRVLGLLGEPSSIRAARISATAVLDGGLLRLAGPSFAPLTVGVVLAPAPPSGSGEGV